MNRVPFIFSEERKYKIGRHLSFWAFWWLFQTFLYSYTPALLLFSPAARFGSSAIDSFCFLTLHIFSSYAIMYFIIPHFLLKQRYWSAGLLTAAIFLFTGFLSAVFGSYVIRPIHLLLNFGYLDEKKSFAQINFLSLLAGLRGGITVSGIAATIKLSKYWYIKEQRNLQLQKENVESQLTILKAQVHPHFLFNTLNNLYSLTLIQSKAAPVIVTHLSELLRYMLYECNDKEVLLDKEMEALKKYVELEKLRYGNRIEVSFVCSGNTKDLKIAPLLLLPFVENSFKHGISEQLDQCWINLHVYTEEGKLYFHLSNSSTNEKKGNGIGGIGLQNIKKRLELIYPNQFELLMNESDEIFNVKLILTLKSPVVSERTKEIETELTFKPLPAV